MRKGGLVKGIVDLQSERQMENDMKTSALWEYIGPDWGFGALPFGFRVLVFTVLGFGALGYHFFWS